MEGNGSATLGASERKNMTPINYQQRTEITSEIILSIGSIYSQMKTTHVFNALIMELSF